MGFIMTSFMGSLIQILFGLKKSTEYEYEYYSGWKNRPNTNTNIIRFENIDRIRIRILVFGPNYSNNIRIPNYSLTSELVGFTILTSTFYNSFSKNTAEEISNIELMDAQWDQTNCVYFCHQWGLISISRRKTCYSVKMSISISRRSISPAFNVLWLNWDTL